jgi:hypothetical protein
MTFQGMGVVAAERLLGRCGKGRKEGKEGWRRRGRVCTCM